MLKKIFFLIYIYFSLFNFINYVYIKILRIIFFSKDEVLLQELIKFSDLSIKFHNTIKEFTEKQSSLVFFSNTNFLSQII